MISASARTDSYVHMRVPRMKRITVVAKPAAMSEPIQNSCPVDKASGHSKEAIVETIRLRESYQSMVATMYFA
jgi:hypothetical protein